MESAITSKIITGCDESFEQAYYLYRDKLYFYFLKKINDQAICKDLVQEVFIKLWRYRTSLRTDLSLSLQIFRIAKTTLIDLFKHQALRRVEALPDEMQDTVAAPASEEKEEENKHLTYLNRKIQYLPPIRKKIMEYRLQGFSNQEIAALMSISKRTVENHLNKAFCEIRKNAEVPTFLVAIIIERIL